MIQPTVQIALGLNAGEGEGEGAGLTDAEEASLKQLGRAVCRLGGVFSPIGRVISVGVYWELGRETRLRAIHGNLLTPEVAAVTNTEIEAITPLV